MTKKVEDKGAGKTNQENVNRKKACGSRLANQSRMQGKKKKNQFIKGIIKVDSYVPLFG